MKSQSMLTLVARLLKPGVQRSLIFGSGLLLTAAILFWQLPGRFGLAAESARRNPGAPSAASTGTLAMAGNVSGTVFEDVNYGGGAGRNLTASSGALVQGARVEL